jgi:malate dehydrogenase (oxaloacetate-decarboxylating)(NADP+)
LIVSSIQREKGCSEVEARKKIWLYDSKGIVHSTRKDNLTPHKKTFVHDLPGGGVSGNDLMAALNLLRPTVLVGVSAQHGSFNENVCKKMASISEVPLILALSNPTSKAECTAAQAYQWTDGKCVFFSGSPFDPVTMPDGRVIVPGQGNNA